MAQVNNTSWISLDDMVGAIQLASKQEFTGPVNLTAPNPVNNKEFTGDLQSHQTTHYFTFTRLCRENHVWGNGRCNFIIWHQRYS